MIFPDANHQAGPLVPNNDSEGYNYGHYYCPNPFNMPPPPPPPPIPMILLQTSISASELKIIWRDQERNSYVANMTNDDKIMQAKLFR